MRRLIRKDPYFSIDELPALKSNAFRYKGRTGYTGSIVRRPVKDAHPYKHYAFVYGFDEHDTLLLIENNEDGVECISWRDFLAGCSEFEFVYFEKNPGRLEEIIQRVKERAAEPYCIDSNNCEHFVNYCVYRKLESFQAKVTIKVANIILSLMNTRLFKYTNMKNLKVFEGFDHFRRRFNLNGNDK
ncbi:MAG: lecithin retinol acyltransferase family protein [Bacteroidota bacterium]